MECYSESHEAKYYDGKQRKCEILCPIAKKPLQYLAPFKTDKEIIIMISSLIYYYHNFFKLWD